VLDEAHLLFNTQRGLQVGLTLRRLELWLESEPQVVALSATIGTASEVWRFFRPGRTVVDVAVTGGRPLEYRIRLDESDGDLAARVRSLADQKVLIFVNSRKECELLVDRLRSVGLDPGRVFAHHSSLSNDLRLHVEAVFAEVQHGVCVATSTLELGIDIGSIDLVILHGVPADWKALAQRVGRGNRKQTHIEAVFSVPVRTKRPATLLDHLSFQGLLAEMNSGADGKVVAQELLGAYAQQLCSELDARGTFLGINRLVAIGEPWGHLDRRTTVEILDSLVEAGVLQKHPAYNRYGPDDGLHELRERWQIWSNFSGSGQTIDVRTNTRHVGQISTGNLQALQVGDVILLGGQRWRIDRMSPRDVVVSSTQSKPNREVQQDGTPITPSRSLVDWIRRVICDSAEGANVHPRPAASRLTALVEPIREALRAGLIPLHRAGSHFHYLTFAGSLINDTLAARFGVPELSDSIVLTMKTPLDVSEIPDLVDELAVGTLSSPRERSGFQNLLPDHLISQEDHSILLSEPVLGGTLHRLRNGSIVEVEAHAFLQALGIT
jgi:ATP-dependent Lhr-like helicase